MKFHFLLFLASCCILAPLPGAGAAEPKSLTLAEALDQPGWTFITGGDAAWHPQVEESQDGLHAARSGNIGHSQQAWVETTVEGPGTLSFWWKVSSEEDFDFLEVHIGGVLQDQVSGTSNWTRKTYPLDDGAHTVRWRYLKDSSLDADQDCGWLDQVSFAPDDALAISPAEPWQIDGFSSVPVVASQTYTFANDGDVSASVSATTAADWLEIPETNLTIEAGQSLDLTVTANSQAAALPAGTHEAQLVFTNLTTGVEHVREVLLVMLPPPGQTEITDSVAPSNDHDLPFGERSVGTTRTETIRVRNTHPENNLLVDRIRLLPMPAPSPPEPAALSNDSLSPPPPESRSAKEDDFSPGSMARPPGRSPPAPDWSLKHDPDTILVRFKKTARAADRLSVHRAAGGSVARVLRRIPLEVIRIPEGANPQALAAAYQKNPHVEYAEPDYLVSIENQPNDPRFGQLWALENSGQTGGLAGADISAIEAWTWTRGSEQIVVAVIDTGIDYTHPDLAANMWINPNPTFGDVHGASWTDGDGTVTNGDPMDDDGHGTHVAGTIGAVGDNGVGVTGVNWNIRLMALKFITSEGFGSTSDAIAAIEYAVDHGAHVSNNSWGGGGNSQALKDMIAAAGEANHLFVTAAGNAATDNDTTPSYPASYDLDNILAVASSDHSDERSYFSNYGRNTVHLAAAGSAILSTIPGGGYDTFSGTSMATPHVAGVAGLVLSIDPSAEYGAVKEAILQGVTPLPQWEDQVISGGRLSAAGALANIVKEYRILDLPDFPVSLTPGRSLLLEVMYQPRDAGLHQAKVLIESQNTDNPSVEVLLSGTGAMDAMEVLQEETFTTEGYLGGPFAPGGKTYTVRNAGSAPVSWSAAGSVSWLALEPSAGTLAPGEEVAVEAVINSASHSLPAELHLGEITFANASTGLTLAREVRLTVRPWPGRLSITDSVSPMDDLEVPFGWAPPDEETVETVALHNNHDTNSLIVEDILLLGGYREDFEKPHLLGWDPRPADRWELASGGRYQASMAGGGTAFMQATYLEEVWHDAAFEVKLRRQGDPDTAAVLLLRASTDFDIQKNAGSAILVGLNGNGQYYVARVLEGGLHWIQSWSHSSALNTGTTANVIVASIRNDRLHLFANDSLLWSGTAGGIFRPGRFGLAAYTSAEAATTHHFEYVEIREPLPEDSLQLTASQSWHNAHPAGPDEDHSILRSRPVVPAMPAGKLATAESFDYASLLNRPETFRLADPPELPRVLAPGASALLPVRFSPSGEGNFTRTLRIRTNDPDQAEVDVALSGSSELDSLRLHSLVSIHAQGEVGGPFTPASATIGLFNSGEENLSWQATAMPPWMDAAVTSGTLSGGASTEASFSIQQTADKLPRGRHESVLEILNTATGFVRAVPVTLEVRPTLCEALNACEMTWKTGGSDPWFGQDSVTRRIETAAQSGKIEDDRESWIETVVDGPGRVGFWWMVSSEQGFDFLEFYVNGERKAAISGETVWEEKTHKLPEGTHTLRWAYVKDFSWMEGKDAAWLDEVIWTRTAPARVISADRELSFGVVPLGQSASRTLPVENRGDSTLSISGIAFPEGFSGNWSTASIAPGSSRDLVVTFTPESSGHHDGVLKIKSNATAGAADVALSGSSALAGEPVELENHQAITGLAGTKGNALHFLVDAPAHREWMEIRIFGGTGDADLYVRRGARPTLEQWDFAPYQIGNKETVFISYPAAGDWHFLVHGFEDFAGVSISAGFAELSLDSWAVAIGLPSDRRGLLDRHGPMNITTLQAYAFGRDPRLLTAADLPRIEWTESTQLRLIYQVQPDANDISVMIETSSDLLEWTSAAPVSETVSASDGLEVCEAIFDVTEGHALFIRATVRQE